MRLKAQIIEEKNISVVFIIDEYLLVGWSGWYPSSHTVNIDYYSASMSQSKIRLLPACHYPN